MSVSLLSKTALACVFLALPVIATPGGAGREQAPSACEKLLAAEREVRLEAQAELSTRRAEVVAALLENLTQLSAQPDRAYAGPFHATVQVVGDWRVEEAAPLLVPLVGFTLDHSTLRADFKLLMKAYYPVAQALAKIGGKAVTDEILGALNGPTEERAVRASAWVLSESMGSQAAIAVVDAALKKAAGQDEKHNLAMMRALLEKGESLLPLPAEFLRARSGAAATE